MLVRVPDALLLILLLVSVSGKAWKMTLVLEEALGSYIWPGLTLALVGFWGSWKRNPLRLGLKDTMGLAALLLWFSELVLVKAGKGNFKRARLGDHGQSEPNSI